MMMEQNNTFDEKKYLMQCIKERCCSNPKLHKWMCVICSVFVVVMAVLFLRSGKLLQESNYILLFLLLALSSYLSLKFGQKIKPLTDPRELLREYDKHNRRGWVLVIVFTVVYMLPIIFFKQDLLITIVVAGVCIVLLFVLWLAGVLNDRNIERLRELVKQENDGKKQ